MMVIDLERSAGHDSVGIAVGDSIFFDNDELQGG